MLDWATFEPEKVRWSVKTTYIFLSTCNIDRENSILLLRIITRLCMPVDVVNAIKVYKIGRGTVACFKLWYETYREDLMCARQTNTRWRNSVHCRGKAYFGDAGKVVHYLYTCYLSQTKRNASPLHRLRGKRIEERLNYKGASFLLKWNLYWRFFEDDSACKLLEHLKSKMCIYGLMKAYV